MNLTDPLPCPCCGGAVTLDVYSARNQPNKTPETVWCAFVKCNIGCLERGTIEDTKERAVAALLTIWNRREITEPLVGILLRLVSAKNEKDVHGETAKYRRLKDGAWEAAKKVLSETKVAASLVKLNAYEDPGYAPYCMRCGAMGRMPKIEPFYWRCACGAEHDERSKIGAPL